MSSMKTALIAGLMGLSPLSAHAYTSWLCIELGAPSLLSRLVYLASEGDRTVIATAELGTPDGAVDETVHSVEGKTYKSRSYELTLTDKAVEYRVGGEARKTLRPVFAGRLVELVRGGDTEFKSEYELACSTHVVVEE